MNNLLTLTGHCDLEAAKGDKPAKVSIVAYSGAEISLPPFSAGPVVIDSGSIKLADGVTLLSDHDASRGGVIGSGTASLQGHEIHVSGTISRASEAGREIIGLAADGVKWQASVGIQVSSREQLRPGEIATVNGRSVKAGPQGMTIVRGGVLREVSVTALGADASTVVSIAARAKGKVMSWFKRPADEPAEGEVGTLTADDDSIRTTRINAMVNGGDWSGVESDAERLRLEAIADGRSVDEVQAALGRMVELRVKRESRPNAPGARTGSTTEPNAQTLTANLMLRAGHEAAALKAFGEKVVQQSHDLRINNLTDLCAAALRLDRHDVPRDRGDMLKAAFSTVNLPTILSNTLGRSLLPYYEELTSDVFKFCAVRSAANFKDQTDIRPSALQSLELVGAGGEIKHASPAEEDTYQWSIDTYAKMLTITRTDIINDDLRLFDSMPQALAQSASRQLLDLIWSLVLGGQTAGHFASGNGNLLEAGSALAIGTLGTAVKTFRDQRDNAGNNIGISPAVLVVPTALEVTARALLNSAEIVDGTATAMQPNGNPVRGIVPNLLVEPRLSNSDKFTGTSSASYYLFGAPQSAPVVVGFLDGRRTPTIETSDAPFNTLGISLRCYHDFGVAFGDPRAALKATGAA